MAWRTTARAPALWRVPATLCERRTVVGWPERRFSGGPLFQMKIDDALQSTAYP